MIGNDVVGWVAAMVMLTAFLHRRSHSLRPSAVIACLAFVACGLSAGLPPGAALRVLLLPVNAVRLMNMVKAPAMDPAAFPPVQAFDERLVIPPPDPPGH